MKSLITNILVHMPLEAYMHLRWYVTHHSKMSHNAQHFVMKKSGKTIPASFLFQRKVLVSKWTLFFNRQKFLVQFKLKV